MVRNPTLRPASHDHRSWSLNNETELSDETHSDDLRHRFATAYLASHPSDLTSLAQLLGHGFLDATKIYVQATAEVIAQRVEKLDLNAYHYGSCYGSR